jgi:hypothetical protein
MKRERRGEATRGKDAGHVYLSYSLANATLDYQSNGLSRKEANIRCSIVALMAINLPVDVSPRGCVELISLRKKNGAGARARLR